jgi:transcriptional regulator with XRE-family HTH domain
MCIDVYYLQNTRTDRGSVSFFEYPKYNLVLPRPIIPPKGYPHEPVTIGEHIRKRRFDIGLLQIEVARMIGVTESTVWNWEHGTEPELRHMPKIIKFLGYVPFECPEDPIGRLRCFKQVNGLSYSRLGELMGRDPEQLTDWLRGRIKPCEKNIKRIAGFLAENA